MDSKRAVTITFGDQAENHVGMQKIGVAANDGFSTYGLRVMQQRFEEEGLKCEYLELHSQEIRTEDGKIMELPEAAVLIIRGAVEHLTKSKDQLYKELVGLEWDTKAKMYGVVRNKHARHNLCFSEDAQEPNYEEGRGRIVPYSQVPTLNKIRGLLPEYFGEKARGLVGEGNLYPDVDQCGIGFHIDGERKRVIALRVGATFPLHFNWFLNSKAIGKRIELMLSDGDMYIMSEDAVGKRWKKIPILRHAAGAEKYLKIKVKKAKKITK